MPASPGYVRLAASSVRSLASAAFDSVREAVLIVNAEAKHLPVVLANATARKSLLGSPAGEGALVDTSLYALLTPDSASTLSGLLTLFPDARPIPSKVLTWRSRGGATKAIMTEIKRLASCTAMPLPLAPGGIAPSIPSGSGDGCLIMLTLASPPLESDVSHALDQLTAGLVILDRDLRVTYANAAAQAFSANPSPAGIVGLSALDLTPTNELPRDVYLGALDGHRHHEDALEIHAPGASRRLELDIQPLRDDTGVSGLAVLYSALSEQRPRTRNETTRHRMKMLTENARDIITVSDREGRLQYVSGGVRNALGYTSEERHLHSIFDLAHPDDVPYLESRFRQLIAGEINRFSTEYRVRHKDGRYRWFDVIYVSAFDDPTINGVVLNSRDITERKEAESRLAQREEVFRLAADAVDGIMYEWDINKGITHRSSGVHDVLGFEPDDLKPTIDAWRERVHPLDLHEMMRKINLALINGRGWTVTYRLRDAHGRYRSMLERALIQRNDNGDPVRAIGSTVDISEVRRLTDLLADTQRTAQTGGWEYSYGARELTWTDEMYRIYDTSRDNFAVSWESMVAQCTPESRQRFHDACVRAETRDGHFDLELEVVTLKSQRIWVRMIGHVEMVDGHPIRSYGSMQNVQSQKLAQISLQKSMGWLKLSMNMAHMHAWRWDKASDELEFAIAEGGDINLPEQYPTLEVFFGRLHPLDRPAMEQGIEHTFKYRCELHQEFRLKADDGRYRSYIVVARPLFDSNGAPLGLVGVAQDVTARRDSEAKLRRSEQLLRVTTTNTSDILMLVDTDLRVRFVNRSVAGRTTEQIVGSDVAELLPLKARASVISRLRSVLVTGETATHEFECEAEEWEGRSGNEPHFFEYRAVLVRDEGTATGLAISVRNTTERRRLEREILDISTRERNTIGRDLHDGLGQELTGIALMLRGLATRVQREAPGAVGQVNEIVRHVNQSIESARSLARGLLPVRTDSGGLPFALRALAGRSRDLYGLEVNFRAELQPEFTLSETSASHLYRIAQEALTNAARHGHASKVEIFLSVTNKNFSLRIMDDGAGLGVPDKPGTGMGLKIMRYRAGMIGAKFEIGPNTPRGTVVRVSGAQSDMTCAAADAG